MRGFRDIQNFIGYSINRKGNIYDLNENSIRQPNFSGGYFVYNLFNSTKNKWITISEHRLLAIVFIPNPQNKRCVNHINSIKTDNRIKNLEWVTYSENSLHSQKMRQMKRNKEKQLSHLAKLNKLFEKKVIQWDANGKFVKEFDSIKETGLYMGLKTGDAISKYIYENKIVNGFRYSFKAPEYEILISQLTTIQSANKELLEALKELLSAGQEALDYKDGSGKSILQEAIWKYENLAK